MKIEVATDRAMYSVFGIATIRVDIKNESGKDLKNVSAEALFSDLAPVRGGSTYAETQTLRAGESLSFTYKATLNKSKYKLNILQTLFLWINRFLNGGYVAGDNGFADERSVIAQTDCIAFGGFSAENKIRVWYGDKTVFVNDFMSGSDEFELFAASCREAKMDGFVFRYQNNVVLLDGGLAGTDPGSVYDYLYALRKECLPSGVSVSKENYKLKIDIVISHFHTDHVKTLLTDIIPSPYFYVDNVYFAEKSDFENTSYYLDETICDPDSFSDGGTELKGRTGMMHALANHAPCAQVHEVPFGDIMTFASDDGRVRFELFAPSQDWGADENAGKILSLYHKKINENTPQTFPTRVANANSLWLKVSYADVSMLFTGDVMKRSSFAYLPEDENYVGEPFDLMLSYYAKKCGDDVFDVDILKFPHHGALRAEASKAVFEVMKPSVIICTSAAYMETTIEPAAEYWAQYQGAYYLARGNGLYFYTDGHSIRM